MKPESRLLKRRDKFIESLKELAFPFVLAYANTFDTEGKPLGVYVHGAGRELADVDNLLTVLGQSAYVNLYGGKKDITQFSELRTAPAPKPEPEPEKPCVVLEEPCSS